MMRWKTCRGWLDLSKEPIVMGILNVTPNSFSDGGHYVDPDRAVQAALLMVEQGAEIIDIGGESTRPGAAKVSVAEEILRTESVIKKLRAVSDVSISIDTTKSEVAAAAMNAGADIVNDVSGLTADKGMAELCIAAQAAVCVMHMQGTPKTMQDNPRYDQGGVMPEVEAFFSERLETLTSMGMNAEAICFDPGIGFGKLHEHNLELLRGLGKLQTAVSRPLLLGVSRKSVVGRLTGEMDPEQRDTASAAITVLAYQQGIQLHRVHNVLVTTQSLAVTQKVLG